MHPVPLLLAQPAQPAQTPRPGAKSDAGGVFLWVAVLIAVIMVGGLVVMWLRRRMFSAETLDHSGGLMESLRKMRDTGQMSQQEYDAARKAMAARVAKMDLGPKKASGPAESR